MSDFEILGKVEQQLQNCLSHFYDYAFLYQHTLLNHLFPEADDTLRVQLFREHVTKAIELLQPDTNIVVQEKASRAYNVLTLRYIHQYEIEDILQRLMLSRRQYFREHAKALETLVGLLTKRDDTPIAAPDHHFASEISIESEIASLNQNGNQIQIDLDMLLEGVIDASKNLAAQHNIQLMCTAGATPTYVNLDRVLLRQIALSVCTSLILNLMSGSQLHCENVIEEGHVIIRWIIRHGQLVDESLLLNRDQKQSLQKMLDTIGGELHWSSSRQTYEIHLPYRQYRILVVDDNPDVVALFRRYLANQPVEVVSARDGLEAFTMAQEQTPHIIILDIMLPHQDGLEILQKFKTSAQTKNIPVLICSILDVGDLVMSLGAEGFIHKPPGQQEFVTALSRWFN